MDRMNTFYHLLHTIPCHRRIKMLHKYMAASFQTSDMIILKKKKPFGNDLIKKGKKELKYEYAEY